MTPEERLLAEKEFAAIDALENLLEYVKRDIMRHEFVDQELETFQAKLIEYRSNRLDDFQDALNREVLERS